MSASCMCPRWCIVRVLARRLVHVHISGVTTERALLQQALEKRWGQAEKEVHLRMRAFARYMPQGEHEALADGLINENRLRARIAVGPRSSLSHTSSI